MNAAEKKIADFLDEVGIKYIYENPQLIEQEYTSGGKKKKFLRIFYPDFFLSEFGILLEFWGMHEDKEYSKVMVKKKEDYYNNWLFVVNVYNLERNWKEYILKKIKDVSEHRLKVVNRSIEKFNEWPAEKKAGEGKYVPRTHKGAPQKSAGHRPQRSSGPPRSNSQRRPNPRSRSQRSRPQQSRSNRPRPQQPRPAQKPPVLATAKPEQAKPAAKKKTVKKVPVKPAAKKKVVKKAVKKTVKKKTVKKAVKKVPAKKGILKKIFKKD